MLIILVKLVRMSIYNSDESIKIKKLSNRSEDKVDNFGEINSLGH